MTNGSEDQHKEGMTYAQLVEEANKRIENPQMENEKKEKGLEFMALRLDVAERHLELAVKKMITPAEDNLIKILEMGTIGARNSRSQICSKALFYISDLSDKLGYKTQMKIWKILKSLEDKKYIIREKTRDKGREILGLNPATFGGQVLNDKQHDIEKRRHLKLIPSLGDNSQNSGDNSDNQNQGLQTERVSETNTSFVGNKQTVCDEDTNRLCSETEVPEFIGEKSSLDSSRFILDSLRGQNGNGESCTLKGETGSKSKQLSDPEQEKKRQLEAARLAGIL